VLLATKEASLQKALMKMQADWQDVSFRVVEYKDTGTYVIGGTDEVQVRQLRKAGFSALFVLTKLP